MRYFDYGQRNKALEALWNSIDTDWEWGYEEQQTQVAGLMAALLPSEGGGASGAGDTEFKEVARKGRRNNNDCDADSYGSDELRTLSPYASQVAPAVAQRLEQLAKLEDCNLALKLDDRAWSALAALTTDDALQVVGQVAGQLQKTPGSIRNVNAVLMAHAGKHLREHPRPGAPAVLGPSTGKAPAAVPPMGMKASPKPVLRQPVTPGTKREAGNLSTLSPEVQEKARELMHLFGPFLTVAHFDSGVVSVLKQMGDTNAQQALDAVKASCNGRGAKDWSKLANPSAYIMSIISPFIRKR